jgi:hypothetical protein
VGLGPWAAENNLPGFGKKKTTFLPLIFTIVRFSFFNSKIMQIISLNFLNNMFYLSGAVLKAVLL